MNPTDLLESIIASEQKFRKMSNLLTESECKKIRSINRKFKDDSFQLAAGRLKLYHHFLLACENHFKRVLGSSISHSSIERAEVDESPCLEQFAKAISIVLNETITRKDMKSSSQAPKGKQKKNSSAAVEEATE